jgi:hypothetical protein
VSATLISSTQAAASWDSTGIAAVTEAPILYFESNDGLYTHFASVASDISITKELEIVSSTSSLECSFAGGCTYAIESSSLYATLLDSSNSIQVFGSECALNT